MMYPDVSPVRHLGTQSAKEPVDPVLAAQWLCIVSADLAAWALVLWGGYVIGRNWGLWS